MAKSWTKADIPSLKGKLAVVTGATGGLGFETALGLAEAGAKVILVGRNDTKGKEALEKIKSTCPAADIIFEKADLGSLKSIKEFCGRFNAQYQNLDILVNNAGIMSPPTRKTTEDGFEIQLGTNHLGHFALTAQLLPALRNSLKPRIVHVSSMAHRRGKINFEDLQYEKSYNSLASYAQSKLSNLLFMLELQRQSDANGWGLVSIGAHPGYARTDLVANGPGNDSWLFKFVRIFLEPILSHSAADGALPLLMAATSPEAREGEYYGPNGFREMYGPPAKGVMVPAALDKEVAKKFWDISTTLTGVSWPQ